MFIPDPDVFPTGSGSRGLKAPDPGSATLDDGYFPSGSLSAGPPNGVPVALRAGHLPKAGSAAAGAGGVSLCGGPHIRRQDGGGRVCYRSQVLYLYAGGEGG